MSPQQRHALLAEGLARQGVLEPAVESCVEAIAADATDARSHALLGELMLQVDAHDAAIAAATRAIELDPDLAVAYAVLGLVYERRGGMWDQAALVWHELAEVAPHLATAHVQLGEAFSAAGFDDEAIDAWRRALEVDPGQARAMYDLAIAALRKEGVPTALPGFRSAGELDPSQDDFFFELAGITRAGDLVVLEPDAVAPTRDARIRAAATAAAQEDYFGAADLVRLVLDETPDDAEALALAGFLYLKQKASNEAMAVALRALAVSPRLPMAVYVLGVAFAGRSGMNGHAARVLEALASAEPAHPMAHVLLGEALLGEARYAEAGEAYRRAVALDPTCVRGRFGLAAVLLAENRHAEAMWEIRQASYYDTRQSDLFWTLWDADHPWERADADA